MPVYELFERLPIHINLIA